MKKNIKRLVAVLVVMAMIISMCSTAFAAGRGNGRGHGHGSQKQWSQTATQQETSPTNIIGDSEESATDEAQISEESSTETYEVAEDSSEASIETYDVDEETTDAATSEEVAETTEETVAEKAVEETTVEFAPQKVGDMTIHVNAPEGAFEPGTEMKVEKVSDPDVLVKALSALDDDSTYSISAVDISFWKDGEEVEPAIPVEVTWESSEIDKQETEIVHIEDNGSAEKVTDVDITDEKAVFTAESFSTYTTTRKDTIAVEDMGDNIVFEPSSLIPTEFNSGEIASTHPTFEGYTFNNATIVNASGVEDTTDPVVYIGAFIYTDETTDGKTYIYYRTESTAGDSDLIVRLVDGEKIKLNYNSTPSTVTYRVVYNGITYTLGADCSLPNELKTALGSDADALVINGPSSVAINTEYERAITVAIPRGYSATGSIAGTTMNPALGASTEPTYSLDSNNKVITKTGELKLDGVYDFPATTSNNNPVVTINLTKRSSFTFDASYFLSTVYTGGRGTNTMGDSAVNTNSNARITGDGSLGQNGTNKGKKTFSADAVSWSFTTNNTENSHWLMDALEINGTTIEVPYGNSGPVSKETILPSGTVVTVTLNSVSGTGRNARRNYTIAVSNCYENIVISGGNIYNADNSTEIIPEVLDNVTYDFYGFSSSDNAYSSSIRPAWITGWGVGEPIAVAPGNLENSGTYDMYRFGQTNNNAMRFSIPAGYVNPKLAFVTSTEGNLHDYIRLGNGLSFGSGDSEHYYPVNGTPTNGYYYFRITGIGNNNKLALLRIKAELARYGVSYSAGSVTGATVPAYDYGGYYDDAHTQLRGYNVEDNDVIVLDKSAPVDPSKNNIFLYYTINGDSTNTHYAPSQKIPLADVAKFAVYDSSKGEYVIPFVAHWEKAEQVDKVNVSVNIYLDDEFQEKVTTVVPENSAIYIDIDSDTMTDVMDKYNWQLFYDEVGSDPFVDKVTADMEDLEIRLYSKFYVYHSATNTLELHTTKELEKTDGTGKKYIDNKLNIAGLTTEGYYYGGYYKDYTGGHEGNSSSGKNLVKAAADDNNENATLGTDDITALSNGESVNIATVGTSYAPSVAANSVQTEWWSSDDAFTTELKSSDPLWFGDRGSKDTSVLTTGGKGTSVKVARAGIYYLKEVPNSYLRPAQMTTYQRYAGYLRDFILFSTTDDANYNDAGFLIGSTATPKEHFTDSVEITFGPNYDETVTDGKVTVDVTGVSNNGNGKVFCTDIFKVDESAFNYSGIIGTKVIKPYWITPDGLTVTGAAMRREVVKDLDNSGKIEVLALDANGKMVATKEIKYTDYKATSKITE